jgi:Ran GTPase-activating protein (RanGAP) involved in mRNA processing and transport
VLITNDIKDNGALLVLSLKANRLATKEAGRALAAALAGNSTLKELDVSNNNWTRYSDGSGGWMGDGPGFAQELAIGIKDNGGMTSLHIGLNDTPRKEMKEIIRIAMGMESMKMLCEVPIKDKTLTRLDVSGKSLGSGGALVVAEYLRDNGALLVLSLKDNSLCAAGTKALGEGLKGNRTITELDLADNAMGKVSGAWNAKSDMSGVIALANVIRDMRALSVIGVSSNGLGRTGALSLCNALLCCR